MRAGVGDDLISIAGGINAGSLFGGVGNDSFNLFGGQASTVVDTGSGVDSVLLGAAADTLTLTGALTSTSLTAGAGNDLGDQGECRPGYFNISAAGNDALNFFCMQCPPRLRVVG